MSKQKTLDSGISEEKIRCEICGKEFEQITYAHLKTHSITFDEYREQFPDALLVSDGCRKKFSGENHPMYGKYHTEESKQKQRKSHLGKHPTEEARQKMRDAHLGKPSPLKGIPLTEEHKQHMRNSSPHISGKDHPMFGVHRYGKDAPNYGNEAWNKGETKETSESVKKYSKNISKTLKIFYATDEGKRVAKEQGKNRKEFFQTEEGQKWLDEHNRGENAPMYGKESYKKGLTKETDKNIKRGGEKCSKSKSKFFMTEEGQKWLDEHNRGENCPAYGKKPWNYEKTKEIDESVKEYGENGSKTKREFFATEEGQQWLDNNLRGENHPSWKGGISFEPYCEKFDNDLKERVRDFFGRCCYVCGKSEAENGQRLSVHHVNYNKMVCCNDVKPLFVPLCKKCHAKTSGDREYWEEFFTVSLNYLTNGECFIPKEVNKN